MDLLSFLASVTGIASFIFYLNDKNPKWWSKLITPVCTALGGFALGRISSDIERSTSMLFQNVYSLFTLILFVTVCILSIICISRKQELTESQFMAFLFFIFFAGTSILFMNIGNPQLNSIPDNDFIVLAKIKEESKDFDQAVKYLEMYKDRVEDLKIKKSIDVKIENIRKKQFQ